MSSTKRFRLVAPSEPNAPRGVTTNPQNVDVLDQLRKLGALRTLGALTQEEYEAKRLDLRARLLAW